LLVISADSYYDARIHEHQNKKKIVTCRLSDSTIFFHIIS